MNVALAKFLSFKHKFTAEELKSTCIFKDEGRRNTGIKGVDRAKLNDLLVSKNITEEQFKAAMFTNVLTPERFEQLDEDMKVAAQLGDDDAPPVPPVAATAAGEAAAPREAARNPEKAIKKPRVAEALGAAPLQSLPATASGSAAEWTAVLNDPVVQLEAGLQELRANRQCSLLVPADDNEAAAAAEWLAGIEEEALVACGIVEQPLAGGEPGLRSTRSCLLPSGSGPLVPVGSSGGIPVTLSTDFAPSASVDGEVMPVLSCLGRPPSSSLAPWASGGLAPAGSAGARRGLCDFSVMTGILKARRSPSESAAAMERLPETASLLAASQSAGGATLGPTWSSGAFWIPSHLAATASEDVSLRPAISAGAQAIVFAQLAQTFSSLPPVPSAEARAAGAGDYGIQAGEAALRENDLRCVAVLTLASIARRRCTPAAGLDQRTVEVLE